MCYNEIKNALNLIIAVAVTGKIVLLHGNIVTLRFIGSGMKSTSCRKNLINAVAGTGKTVLHSNIVTLSYTRTRIKITSYLQTWSV